MNPTLLPELREFTRTVLEQHGSLVEWDDAAPEGLAVLAPDTAAALKAPETLRLAWQSGGDGLCVNLATDFLDRMAPLLESEPRTGCFRIPELYLKKAPMAEPVARAFTWQNAKVRVDGVEAQRVEYHTWYFLAAVDSDDRWEELLSVTINSSSGAEVAIPDPLHDGVMGLCELGEGLTAAAVAAVQTYPQAAHRAGVQLERQAGEFVGRLESRLERDRHRLREYYRALLSETKSSQHRAPEDPQQQAAKRRAVELELRRKLAELDERYALRVTLTPQALVRLDLSVLAVGCTVFRKKARRSHTLYWNPLIKALEPIACVLCGASLFSVSFTDNEVQPLCRDCAADRPGALS